MILMRILLLCEVNFIVFSSFLVIRLYNVVVSPIFIPCRAIDSVESTISLAKPLYGSDLSGCTFATMLLLSFLFQSVFVYRGSFAIDWFEFKGWEYGISGTVLSFKDAFVACQNESSHLADVHDAEVWSFVLSKISQSSEYWVGAYRVGPRDILWASGVSIEGYCMFEPTYTPTETSARIDYRGDSFCIADLQELFQRNFICQRILPSTCQNSRSAHIEAISVNVSSSVLDTLAEIDNVSFYSCVNECFNISECTILGYDESVLLCKLYNLSPFPSSPTNVSDENLFSFSSYC